MKAISRILAVLLIGVSLGSCAGGFKLPSLNVGGAVTLNTLEGVISAYGLVLNAEIAYKSLPLCKTGTTTSATNICAKRSIIVRLQAADKVAVNAISNADSFVKTYPTLDASNVLAAAQTAISNIQSILNSTGVQ